MFKELLKKEESVVYQSLDHAFKRAKVNHSYLLDGPRNPLKLATALLIAQSIVEDKGGLACEECDTCKRIEAFNYADLILIDGEKRKIKKDDIDDLIKRFTLSSIEREDKKIYIINNVNNLAKVENIMKLLKFMEEPPSPNIYGILISDNSTGLLDTIVSRSQILHFHAPSNSTKLASYLEMGFDQKDAAILAKLNFKIEDLNDEDLLLAKDMCDQSIGYLYDGASLAKEFYEKVYNRYKDNQAFDRFIKIYIEYMIDHLSLARDARKLDLFLKLRDDLNMNFDRKLLIDALCFEIGR